MEEYCALKGLTINASKTKIMVFRRGGPTPEPVLNLVFNNEPIEVVNSYVYLSVTFSCSGLGSLASKESHRKARIAVGTVLSVLANAKADSWSSALKLYDSLAASVLLYGAHLTGLRYADLYEKSQLFFFKRLFQLPRNTPGFTLRLELGVAKVTAELVKAGINWVIKILKMDRSRLPRIFFERLLQLKDSPNSNPRYNWLLQLATPKPLQKTVSTATFGSQTIGLFGRAKNTSLSTALPQALGTRT